MVTMVVVETPPHVYSPPEINTMIINSCNYPHSVLSQMVHSLYTYTCAFPVFTLPTPHRLSHCLCLKRAGASNPSCFSDLVIDLASSPWRSQTQHLLGISPTHRHPQCGKNRVPRRLVCQCHLHLGHPVFSYTVLEAWQGGQCTVS